MNQPTAYYSRRCWVDGMLKEATVVVEAETITEVLPGRSEVFNFNDLGNLVLMPGVIDSHVHINTPGRTHWEGFESATRAAAFGGITTIVDMPLNSDPVTVSVDAFEKKLNEASNKIHVNCGFWGGLVPGSLQHLESLIRAGVLGIKVFLIDSGLAEFPPVDEKILSKGMQVIAPYKIPLLAHCELYTPHEKEAMLDENPSSYRAYLDSRPQQYETDAIDLLIRCVEKTGCRAHIVHLSASDALPAIIKKRNEGLSLTLETCPHYIYFKAEEILDGNTLYKCAPPIREGANNQRLKEALQNADIDFIASDHSPVPPEMKCLESGDFKGAWGGFPGLQFLLPASWTALKDFFDLESFIPLLTERPANFLGMGGRKGRIAPGYDADLTVWDPQELAPTAPADIQFRHKIGPYIGEEMFGNVKQTIIGGRTVYSRGKMIESFTGKIIRKTYE